MLLSARSGILLKGTHGTSNSRAEAIVNSGNFQPSADGILGAGVYFWAYEKDMYFAKQLAANWWRFAGEKFNAYRDDSDPSLAVLNAHIEIDNNVYFDASTESFRELLIKTAKERAIQSRKDDFNKLRAVLLKEIESIQGFQYGVVRAEVEVPGKAPGESETPYVYLVAKQAASYIVMPHALGTICNIELVEV